MKKILLQTLCIICISINSYSQQADVYYVMSYDPGTCNVQVEYWLSNPTNGNGSIQVAVSFVNFQWDSTLFSFYSYTSLAEGLDQPDQLNSTYSDAEIYSSRTISGTSFRSLLVRRSTNKCDNLYILDPGESKPFLMLKLHLRNCSDANYYHWTTNETDPLFPGEVNNGSSDPSNTNRKILAIINNTLRPQDKSGAQCPAGGTFTNSDIVPIGTEQTAFVNDQAPLPIVLKEFKIAKSGSNAIVSWQTEQEFDTKGFEIQRKTTSGFKTIALINSQSPDGNSSSLLSYSFKDPAMIDAAGSFYRLKQIRLDDKFGYSDIKSVRLNNSLNISIYPNPSKGDLNIVIPEGSGKYDVTLSDYSGRMLKQWNNISNRTFNLNDINAGMYFIRLYFRDTGEQLAKRIIIEK